ncbi:DUF7266 family protein [Haloarchaeobius sp. TZWWS8]|uniref:DUF7266 family protein n=1 Tax=Haloarchaeobius sp. TZWWS8 TaxID=3446121 RepID=UPI003EBA6225
MRDDRGVSPVVAKALETSLVLLYLGLLTSTLYAGVVPDYRSSAGDEVADRTLSAAAQRIEVAVPPNVSRVSVRQRVDLPTTIRSEPYSIRADGNRLLVVHPDPAVHDELRLSLPDHVLRVEGNWSSLEPAVVVVEDEPGGVVVRLERGDGG